ncbi:threonine synthase [Pelagovum pacificum]|uniref:Threonine synthase n=1 Tax=Pelagovum pacificum TaxID=2588711 RepID=A0A5C5GD46_9RHOB|nr:threonine synthase [Pelagovum pacificum]QQA44136.1 threonine synthase [Pelagovum pacificum]TNY32735.1 threonine synthase [Pelagovum pacificum]
MRYVSTRGAAPALGFEDTMMTGLARDGGLYVPEDVPTMSAADIAALAGLPYEEAAFRVIRPFVADAFTESELQDLIARAYAGFGHPARAPLKQLGPNQFLLELFHGPTLAFKDFAMQLIGQLMQAALQRSGERITIVGATSGDTGSAAIEAFRGLPNVDVFILYPHGRVSEVQRRQMTTPVEDNVHALALHGHFDDCQARLKDMFNDHEFRDGVRLAGVNSINWARVLAQVVYYFTAATTLGAPHRTIDVTVPTGNFGDIFAGCIARRMGLPLGRLYAATNQNDVVNRALKSGLYQATDVTPSYSPSMDIQVSSNFERALFDAYGRDGNAVRQLMDDMRDHGQFKISQGAHEALTEVLGSGMTLESATLQRIQTTLAETGELVCPHTAVGLDVAERKAGDAPMITLATAHPAKFPDAVEEATGIRPPLPSRMSDLYDRPERVTEVENDLGALQQLIRDRISK